jgi:hypothetical protein
MKFTLHIPTEQYGFCEAEFEADDVNIAAHNYKQIADSFLGGAGLPDKDFDKFVENQLGGGSNHIEDWEKMSPEQRKYIQINKRALNRLEAKLARQ